MEGDAGIDGVEVTSEIWDVVMAAGATTIAAAAAIFEPLLKFVDNAAKSLPLAAPS